MTTIAERIAAFLCATREIPQAARASAARCVLDLVSAAIAGYDTANATSVRRVAGAVWGSGPAAIWFTDQRSTAAGAAFANAAAACALDLDDGHRAAAGHPGAAVIPAVFAALDIDDAGAERALTAIALGYEVGVRISGARDLRKVPTTNTGLWCGQAVAAAVGWLRGLTPAQLAHAMAIAGTTAPSQSATPYTRFRGNSVKEGIPWGAANGLLAVELARTGFTGPVDIFDEPGRYDPARLLDGPGTSWTIDTTYFKPYSCCRWLHAPVDALLGLMSEHGIAAGEIVAIDVDTFGRTFTLGNEVEPASFEGAQYSLPFCLGVAATRGAGGLLPLQEEMLRDTAALEVSKRVRMRLDAEFDAMFPAAVPGRVRVTTGRGIFERTVLAPKGEPTNPMSWDELSKKFLTIASPRIGAARCSEIRRAIDALLAGDAATLKATLARSLT